MITEDSYGNLSASGDYSESPESVLITKYLNGEATHEEINTLNEWLDADIEHQKQFRELNETWLLIAAEKINHDIDNETDWTTLSAKFTSATEIKFSTYVSDINTETGNNIASEEQTETDSSKPQRGILKQLTTTYGRIAAVLLLLIAAATVIFYLVRSPGDIILTAESGILTRELPDGSVVSLMEGSTVQYADDFSEKRDITLDGVAYFNVRHDSQHPFTVHSENARIRVLGTSFNVSTMQGANMISVVLATGKIALFFKGEESQQIIMTPGERANINTKSKSIDKAVNTDPNYNAWLTKEISFNGNPLSEIVATLEEVYGAEISIANTALEDCTLTATFHRQPLDEVMQVIASTLGCTITKQGQNYLIDGKCE